LREREALVAILSGDGAVAGGELSRVVAARKMELTRFGDFCCERKFRWSGAEVPKNTTIFQI
jgi:hypothetical protein